MIKVLYIGLLYNYGKPEEGYSYEYYNIEHGLKTCQTEDMFDLEIVNIDKDIIEQGVDGASQSLSATIMRYNPDIIIDVPFDDNLCPDLGVLRKAKDGGTKVLSWNCDASWRQDFILNRKDAYSHFITTHSSTVNWFKKNEMKVIRSQWGASSLYKNHYPKDYKYDVSFIGQRHSLRGDFIQAINQAGVKVHLFGHYWDGHPDNHGYIDFEEMVNVFNQSKININFSNPFHTGTLPQIKGRHMEIPACGGFQLSTPADDLESYFVNGKEIVVAKDIYGMVQAIRYYLENEEKRESIAQAGYDRTMKDHTWPMRFKQILEEL